MLSTDFHYITRQLLAIRCGASRDRLHGYLDALSCHCHLTIGQHDRIKTLALNAQQRADAHFYDVQIQGWAEPDPFITRASAHHPRGN